MAAPDKPTPPVAKAIPHPIRAHDHERIDDYYWLRDDERKDPEILEYLAAENAYTAAVMEPVAGLVDSLFDEIVGRIKKDDSTVPYRKNGYWYYTRYEEGKEYPIHCRRKGSLEAAEQILLDANIEAEGKDYYHAGGLRVTHDGALLAYGEDESGRRIYTMRFRDLATGESFAESISGVSAGAAWSLDNQTVFYVVKDATTLREYQVWRHRVGTDPSTDVLVYDETDPEFFVSVGTSKSDELIFVGSWQTITHEVRYIDAAAPESEPIVFLPRSRGHEYSVDHAGGRFYIRTNWDATNFRLMSAAPADTHNREAWREEIGGRDDVFLEGFELFRDHLVVEERADAMTRLRVIPWATRKEAYEIELDEEVFVVGLGTNREYDTATLRFGYTSMTTPASVYDFDMNDRSRTLKKQAEVLGGFDKNDYVTQRIAARADDGTEIPISLVHRKSLDRSRPQPLVLYAYGSYGLSTDPGFTSSRLSLLDRGFIWAIAHVRGGQEHGRRWYEGGKLLAKRNTFTDFIAAAEHLIAEGFTAADELFAIGGSAGGLLMGAIANMRPDLFEGIVARVPFVDVVTTMLDESIPLTTYEYDEWGNPADEEYYRYMLSYSPYDNVAALDYPHVLIMTGLHDSQVQYWEPAKWVAKLRAVAAGKNQLLLHTNMEAGHGGTSGRFRRHRETAMMFAFILDKVGFHK